MFYLAKKRNATIYITATTQTAAKADWDKEKNENNQLFSVVHRSFIITDDAEIQIIIRN